MDLLRSLQRNVVEHCTVLLAPTAGMTVDDGADVMVADSGLADDTFNVVCGARFAPGDADTRIAAVAAQARGTGRPFVWWVDPASEPADLAARLTTAGMPVTGTETAMVLDLTGERVPVRPSNLEIRRVTTPADVAEWAAVLAAGWNPPAESVREFYRRVTPTVLADNSTTLLLGTAGRRAVATLCLVLHEGIAGIYDVSTLASARGRGHASTLLGAAEEIARSEGMQRATLQASGMGIGVYRRLGFVEVGDVTEHTIS